MTLSQEQLASIRERCEKAERSKTATDGNDTLLLMQMAEFAVQASYDIPALLAHITELEENGAYQIPFETGGNKKLNRVMVSVDGKNQTFVPEEQAKREERERVIGILDGVKVPDYLRGRHGRIINKIIQDAIATIKAL